MTNAIFRRFNQVQDVEERQQVLSTGLVSVAASASVLCALGLLGAEPLTRLLIGSAESGVLLVQLTLATALLTTLGEVPFVTLRADRRVKTIAVLNLVRLAVTVALTIWLVVVREMGVLGFVVALLASALVFVAVEFGLTWRAFRAAARASTWRTMARYGLPFVPQHVQAVGLAYFGQYVVAEMLSLEQAGIYNVALRFALPVAFVVGMLQKAWVPYKFEVHATDEKPERFFRSSMIYYGAGLSYLFAGVAVWGPEAVRLMTAPAFHGATVLVPLLALVPLMQGFYFMLGTGIELTDDTRKLPLVATAGLATVVVLSLLLVPPFGAGGAALATACGYVVMGLVIYRFSQRHFQIDYDFALLGSILVLSLLAAAGGILLQDQPALARLFYAAAVTVGFPILVILLLLRSKTERSRVQSLWTRFALSRQA